MLPSIEVEYMPETGQVDIKRGGKTPYNQEIQTRKRSEGKRDGGPTVLKEFVYFNIK